ncbi:hypothetical protein SLEP1_g52695 [Rubroshorea leprosula]|uniref:Uncharacterized protein n=1 Tax=Rubroshorea leprosula TaxID=152421 RepID=A0AAV5M9R7_9ROSI|nr:hypothetical protein SLEP1_g52695 [Rubroshorea leprosula]
MTVWFQHVIGHRSCNAYENQQHPQSYGTHMVEEL